MNSETPAIPILEAYNLDERNYSWEAFKYAIPKKYHDSQNPTDPLPKQKPPHKTNYIDDLQKEKAKIPGPFNYQNLLPMRPLSGKMDKSPRRTLAETIIIRSKKENFPGPTTYHLRPKTAAARLRQANKPEFRQHYLNEVEYLANLSPGVGQYNVNGMRGHTSTVRLGKPKRGSSAKKIGQSQGKQNKSKNKAKGKVEATSVIYPGTFDWMSSQKKYKDKNFFTTMKRFVTGSKFDKKPAPNSYTLNQKWTDPANILKTAASSTSFKSVYYH